MKKTAAKDVYTLADLQDWEKTAGKIKPPIRLGVFGDPVAHSLSPRMQNAALSSSKIDMQYVQLLIRPHELSDGLRLIRDLEFVGANLTVPHKVQALDWVDEIDGNAKRIGALNTIKISDKKLVGFNTDGKGFTLAIRQEFAVDLRDLRILVLGAGGAARAIAVQCAKENSERLVIANRTFETANKLADELRDFFAGPRVLGPVSRLQAIPWEESAIRSQIANIDLVVNATPIGLNRAEASPIPARLLAPHLMVYDTVYAAQRTPLLSAAVEAGARGANGLSMLLYQGALAFEIWFGREAPLDVMQKALV